MTKAQQVFCQIRQEWIAASPEEIVRQRLLHKMLHELGYPASLLVVEKAIHQLPHLAAIDPQSIPDRRIDIMCYATGIPGTSNLGPLIVIECKAVALTWRVISQVLGYNQIIRSPFVAIANETELRTAWFDPQHQKWVFIDHLPSYKELVSSL